MTTLRRLRARSGEHIVPLAGIAALIAGCSPHAPQAAGAATREPVAVVVRAARAEHAEPRFAGPGVVTAAHTYRIAFEISGRVTGVFADVGDRVEAGTTLATIDDRDYRAQLDVASARATSADAQATRSYTGSRPQERAEAGAQVAAMRAALERTLAADDLARRNDMRIQELLGSGDVPAQQGDQTHVALRDADAAVQAARAQLRATQESAALVDAGPRVEDRASVDADARAARANVTLLATTLEKTSIHAPQAAFVQSRSIELGDDAAPGAVAFTLADAGAPDVIVSVPESRIAGIAAGTSAAVRDGARRLSGRVTRVEPSADGASRTYAVRVRCASGSLRFGSVVDVVLGEQRGGGTRVGVEALVRRGAGTYVEVLPPGSDRVEFRSVRVVTTNETDAVVTGVRPGERVVVMGEANVGPGDTVRTVTMDDAS